MFRALWQPREARNTARRGARNADDRRSPYERPFAANAPRKDPRPLRELLNDLHLNQGAITSLPFPIAWKYLAWRGMLIYLDHWDSHICRELIATFTTTQAVTVNGQTIEPAPLFWRNRAQLIFATCGPLVTVRELAAVLQHFDLQHLHREIFNEVATYLQAFQTVDSHYFSTNNIPQPQLPDQSLHYLETRVFLALLYAISVDRIRDVIGMTVKNIRDGFAFHKAIRCYHGEAPYNITNATGDEHSPHYNGPPPDPRVLQQARKLERYTRILRELDWNEARTQTGLGAPLSGEDRTTIAWAYTTSRELDAVSEAQILELYQHFQGETVRTSNRDLEHRYGLTADYWGY